MGSFDEWRRADEQWARDNAELLEVVFQWFLSNGEWPEVGALQHAMYQRSPRIENVQQIANSRPGIPGQFASAIAQGIQLGARHLLNVPGAEYLLASTVRATQIAVEIFLTSTPGEYAQVRLGDLPAATPGVSATRKLVPNFVLSDHPTPFAGGSYGDDWAIGINPATIMKFEGVEDSSDYVSRQLQIIKGWCDDHDAKIGNVQRGGPFHAFIVMPFEEEWSNDSRSFIDSAVSSFGTNLVAERADDNDFPGRVTEQIVNSLEEADLVISDITGNNANVGWELGFAHARSKPCVIVKRRDIGSAPFDIYDQRRVDYSSDPTEEETDRLKRMIRASIDQIKNSVNQEDPGDMGRLFRGPTFLA